jgi:4-amino-4-deoxy-L-arabinose transferase-like glycosyltransferase
MRERATRVALLLLVVALVAVFVDNADRPLANPDEGRYSEISREMAATGDWVTPRLDGLKYFEKPPLQYWASAIAFKAFGETEVGARLYTTACGILTLLLVGFTGWRLGGGDRALASTMALVSAPYFLGLAGVVTLDMGLTLWTTLTFCAFVLAEQAGDPSRAHRRWMLAAWAGMALAVLSKGLIGIVFPAAALFLHIVLRRDAGILRRLHWLPGLAIFLALAAPWFIAVSMANAEFARFFFIHEHFERFLTTTHRRVEPWWYFLPILAAGFLPWMFALPGAFAHAWEREKGTPGLRPLLFAMLFSFFIVIFFSASGSKLPAYILPAFPPLALVLGRYLQEGPTRRLGLAVMPVSLLAAALAYFTWRAPQSTRDAWSRELYQQAAVFGFQASAALFATSILGGVLLLRGRRLLAVVIVAAGSVFTLDCLEDAYEVFSPRQSGLVVAEKMHPWLTRETRLYSVGHYDQTVPFYIGRTVTLVDYVDEFATGIQAEPAKVIAQLADFPAAWMRPGEALAIMQPDLLEKFRAQGLPMQVLHQDPRRVLVRKP